MSSPNKPEVTMCQALGQVLTNECAVLKTSFRASVLTQCVRIERHDATFHKGLPDHPLSADDSDHT
jgi:hypothetical protein